MITAFLNCHVKQESSGCDILLKRLEATQKVLTNGEKEKPWPGFVDRYAVGMKFYRKDM